MSTQTFSKETKDGLCKIHVKRPCCRRALLFGLLFFRQNQEDESILALTHRLEKEFLKKEPEFTLSGIRDLIRCEECGRCFLRGVFLSCGSIVNPQKIYHLELVLPDESSASEVAELSEEMNIYFKKTTRREHPILYLKDNESVSDFLSLIGATQASFAVVNELIRKEIRNMANRQANCDAANINKTISAAMEQLEAIQHLQETGALQNLPQELYETALLRMENEDASLKELTEMHHPPITKSGVNHRLKRIVEFSKKV